LATKIVKKAAPKKATATAKKTATKSAVTKSTTRRKSAPRKEAVRKVAPKRRKKVSIANTSEALELLHKTIVNAILDKKGVNIVSLDLRTIEDSVADYFIICTGEASPQIRAIADHAEEEVRKKLNEKAWHVEGKENMEWVIVDFVNIVLHIFNPSIREYYKLEDLWSDADKQTF
jgi:ribosome-associated protein